MSPEPLVPCRRLPAFRRRSWRVPLLLLALVASAVLYRWNANLGARPLTYRIGTVDPRFGMDREAFSIAVGEAASLWKKAVPRDLFREAHGGVLEINLVYDYRQESADRLKALSLRIDGTQDSFDNLKAHFETLKGEAEQKGAVLAQDFAAYNARVAAFNTQSEAARRTPVSEGVYRRLEAERLELAEVKTGLARSQDELKALAETLNSLGEVINGLAANHNLDLVDYNQTGDRLGPEFSEGDYVLRDGHRIITIYHFPSREGLVRILAHELGHAKGIPHLENPKAVMHRLMRTETLALTPEDIAAMKAEAESR